MPIYEYQCKKCGKVINVFQKVTDPPVRVCPGCLGEMEKLISKTTFHLKGDGWFNDPPKEPGEGKNGTK